MYPRLRANISNLKTEWREDAACLKANQATPEIASAWTDPEALFEYEATNICKFFCKVRTECLIDAVRDKTSEGLRGGYYFSYGAVGKEDAREIRKLYGVNPRTSHQKNVFA